MAKKNILKKIFRKSKSKQKKETATEKDANSASGCRGVTQKLIHYSVTGNGQVSPKTSPVKIANAEPIPQAPQATNSCENVVETRSESAALGTTESDHTGSSPLATKKDSDGTVCGDTTLPSEAIASVATVEQLPSIPAASDLQNEDVATAVGALPHANVDAAGSDEIATGQENEEHERGGGADSGMKVLGQGIEVKETRGDDAELDGKTASQSNNGVDTTKDKKARAEEMISQLSSPSSSKLVEKPEIEVGVNAERRKWIEGLTSPKNAPAVSHVPDDLKKVGKLSDRMKAVEQALEKRKNESTMVSFEIMASPSPSASAQKKAVEEMLQKQLNPNAFLESRGKMDLGSPKPGTQRLTSQRKWVMETLEKQNDPKSFLDKKRESMRAVVDLPNEQKEAFLERKKEFKAKAREADEKTPPPVNN